MTAYLSLGSNLGDRTKNLRTAIKEIESRIGTIVDQSDFIETEPWGYESKNKYLNGVIKIETCLHPMDLLLATQSIEKDMGRTTKTVNEYHDRIIDIDILTYEDLNINTLELVLPHPRMYQRDFVMIPLNQIIARNHNRKS